MNMIGLEIHCQLTSLQSKLFCTCKANYRGLKINENICLICAGIPGSLPRLNAEAVRQASMIAMALNCRMPERIAFFRKNYFYPDLPKNFQITQLNIYGNTSIGGEGHVMLGDNKKIRITRVQLEEDPGRLVYEGPSKNRTTLVDYNRAGTPLVEIVTEPDFENPKQVRGFLNILSALLENLRVSDPGLEGAMRADANVSIQGGNKVEIKNIGSFHDLEKAVHFEITRQESLHSRGIKIVQETRHWDQQRKITVPSRSKEAEADYRYILEGDIPWVRMGSGVLDALRSKMPESVGDRRERYVTEYGVAAQVADILSSDRYYSDLFEEARTDSNAREVANMITSDLMGLADTREKREASLVTAAHLRDLADSVLSGVISRTSAKNVLHKIVKTGRGVPAVIRDMDLAGMSDESEIDSVVSEVISEEKDAVRQAESNPKAIHYLVGKVMKKTRGKADPDKTLVLLRKKINLPPSPPG